MTWAQFGTPVIDVVLVVPKIFKLAQNISSFTNEARMRLKSKPGINGREEVLRGLFLSSKVGYFFPMVIWSEIRRDENHREDAHHFMTRCLGLSESRVWFRIRFEYSLFKFLIFSPFFLSAIACLPDYDEKIKLAVLYKAKIYRKKIISGMKDRDSIMNYDSRYLRPFH